MKKHQGQGYGEFKKAVSECVVSELSKIQERYKEIIVSNQIEDILNEGALKAKRIAERKLEKVERKIGINIHKRR